MSIRLKSAPRKTKVSRAKVRTIMSKLLGKNAASTRTQKQAEKKVTAVAGHSRKALYRKAG